LAINHSGLIGIEKAIGQLQSQRKIEVAAFKSTAEHVASSAMTIAANENIKRISDQLAKTSQKLYRSRELKVTLGWTITSSILGISFFIATNILSYQFIKQTVYEQARQEAYKQASNEKYRASWANTETGKLAYSLAKVTDIKALATCKKTNSGWKIIGDKKNVCIPYPINKNINGWRIPSQ